MGNKCTKFEELFTNASEAEFAQHILSCPDCRCEYEKINNVSKLIQEVKPYYKKQKQISLRLKTACLIIFLALSGLTFGFISLNTDISDTLKYGTTLSSEDLGFPVDSYGLIVVE